MKVTKTRNKWGRARFGGGGDLLLEFTVMALCTLPVTSAFGWGVLVDRSTAARYLWLKKTAS